MSYTPDERARIAARVRALRATKDLTQAQLASAVGKSIVTIRSLENARHPPTAKTVALVATFFRTTPAALAGQIPATRYAIDMETPPTRPQRVNVDLPVALLADIDRICARVGIARAAWIKLTIAQAVRQDQLERNATHGQK